MTGHATVKWARVASLLLALLLAAAGCGGGSQSAAEGAGEDVYLFTQTAGGGIMEADSVEEGAWLLTLTGVSSLTTYFTERPRRNAGTVPTGEFVSGWDAAFSDDPPNAALVFTVEGEAAQESAVCVISDPFYDDEAGTITYRARELPAGAGEEGGGWQGKPLASLPREFGEASLFIDASDSVPDGGQAKKTHFGLCLGLWAQPRQPWSADAAWIEKCVATVAPYTEWITTYDCSKVRGTYNVPAAAKKHGLKVAATAYIISDEAANKTEIANLIELGKEKQIDLAIVGNEPLAQPGVTVDMMVGYLNQVKDALKGTGIKVGTREEWGIICGAEHRRVVDACQFVQVTAYPSTDGKPLNDAARMLLADPTQYYGRVVEVLKGYYGAGLGGREVQVGETGWPSHGSEDPNRYTLSNAAAYHRQVVDLARQKGIKLFYFEAFDEDWKAPNYDHEHYDANWGIWYWEGSGQSGKFVAKQGML